MVGQKLHSETAAEVVTAPNRRLCGQNNEKDCDLLFKKQLASDSS